MYVTVENKSIPFIKPSIVQERREKVIERGN